MDPATAWSRLQTLIQPALAGTGLQLDKDDFGNAIVFARRDMAHLDADELNDRLHAWATREVQRVLPHASAIVSFRHARPATHDEAELDIQEVWIALEPQFRLELARPNATEEELRAFVGYIPAFQRLLEGRGRPTGWRVVDEGNAE